VSQSIIGIPIPDDFFEGVEKWLFRILKDSVNSNNLINARAYTIAFINLKTGSYNPKPPYENAAQNKRFFEDLENLKTNRLVALCKLIAEIEKIELFVELCDDIVTDIDWVLKYGYQNYDRKNRNLAP
jgi:hypothetical protein